MFTSLLQRAKSFFFPRPENDCPDAGMVAEIREIIAKNKQNPSPAALLEELKYVVLDLETTGFNQGDGDEVIAVGAVAVERGQIRREESFHRLIYPYRLVPGKVVALTGIGREMLVGCPGFFGVLPALLEFIGSNVIVGHCIHFDLGFINAKLKKCCQTKIKNRVLDTAILARVLHPAGESYSLDNLLSDYNIAPVGRHSALGDALLTAQLFVNIMAKLKELKVYTLADLNYLIKHRLQFSQQDLTFRR